MVTRYIGIDAIPTTFISHQSKFQSLHDFEKSGSKDLAELKGFFCVLGMGVVVEDYAKFYSDYFNAMKSALAETGYDQGGTDFSESIFCSRDLRELADGEHSIHEAFCKEIKNSLHGVNVFFSSFDTERIPEVRIMGRTREPRAVHPKLLTIKYITNSFPHICIWKLLPYIEESKATVYSDHFEGHRTWAWEQIQAKPIDLNVVYKGDECNPLIATADILLRVLTSRIEAQKSQYAYEHIKERLPEFSRHDKLHIHNINNKHLPHITPRDERNIPLKKYLKRPIFFCIKPNSRDVDATFLLSQPQGKKLRTKIILANGGYKHFSATSDRAILKDGDYMVYFDNEGKNTAELIKRSGTRVELVDFCSL